MQNFEFESLFKLCRIGLRRRHDRDRHKTLLFPRRLPRRLVDRGHDRVRRFGVEPEQEQEPEQEREKAREKAREQDREKAPEQEREQCLGLPKAWAQREQQLQTDESQDR